MEPAIPVGSLVYIKEMAPEDVQAEDVIAFYGASDSSAIVTHRVVENRVVMGELITKGDANKTRDMNPVLYSNFIGKVIFSVPEAGNVALIFSGSKGKFLAAGTILAAIVLHVLASVCDGYGKHSNLKK
jgi:signal peptidase